MFKKFLKGILLITIFALFFVTGAQILPSFGGEKEQDPCLEQPEHPGQGGICLPGEVFAAEKFYTCPMHPNIIREQQGECPICGMDLVEKKPQSDSTGGRSHGVEDNGSHEGHDHGQAEGDGADGMSKTLYTCGMHPNVIQDGPGYPSDSLGDSKESPRQCPICGMDLVPVYEDEGSESSGSTVIVDPVMVQNMGVRVAHVERGPIFRHIRTIGEVDVAEDEISVVNLRFSGWIEKIWVDETGQAVKKGKPLFRIYSPEVVAAQEEYMLALNTEGKDSPLARSARRKLSLWDIPQSHLIELVKGGNAHRNVVVTAPRSGYVLHKNVVQGARVRAGMDLYRIGNLRKIWVNAEIYEFDAPWIRKGQKAFMELSFQKGKQWKGRVGYIHPTLNKMSRTLKVRLEFVNPGIRLKPGMFATIHIETRRKEGVLNIPTEAVIHSGKRQLVFVSRELGKYKAKEIITGLNGDNHRIEVVKGLKEGEAVVTSGQFLLDSESQLQEAIQKLLDARLQVRDQKKSPSDPGHDHTKHETSRSQGSEYWTCSMHPNVVQDGPGTCPICGMDLIKKKR